MRKKSGKRKKTTLKRSKYFFDLKIDKPLTVAFRRSNVIMKQSRASYFAYENIVFRMEAEHCPVAAFFHITSTN